MQSDSPSPSCVPRLYSTSRPWTAVLKSPQGPLLLLRTELTSGSMLGSPWQEGFELASRSAILRLVEECLTLPLGTSLQGLERRHRCCHVLHEHHGSAISVVSGIAS